MSKEGTGRVVSMGKARTRCITVPADVAGDDRFPLTDGEQVTISIDGDHLIISKKK
jgi:antitoxin component of MazEF toxin-antitoxin module